MAWLEETNISKEEHDILVSKIVNLVTVREGKLFQKQNIDRLYGEWEMMAKRVRKGGEMLDQCYANLSGDLEQNEHFQALSALYTSLTRVMGLYDMFFQEILKTEQYQRASGKILSELYH